MTIQWLRSDVSIVNDAAGDTPRLGGHTFKYDGTKGLWRSNVAMRDDGDGLYTVSLSNHFGVWGGVWGNETTPSAPPPSASHLWEEPETVTEEIVAYRAWEYVPQIAADGTVRIVLKSLHHDCYWDGPVTTSDETPAAGSEHGLYALGLSPHHRDNFSTYVEDGEGEVWGRVALSGIVVEGAMGYRAERATIQELWVDPNAFGDEEDDNSPVGLCKVLGDRYQCDASVRAPSWKELVAR